MVGGDLGDRVVLCGGRECQGLEVHNQCWYLKTLPANTELNETRPRQMWSSKELLELGLAREGATTLITEQVSPES